jgi:hypothetical protein
VLIFNRWGDEVYPLGDIPYESDWNGTFDGEELPADTYFYVIDLGDGYGAAVWLRDDSTLIPKTIKIMRALLIFFLLICWGSQVLEAQQDEQFTQWMYHKLGIQSGLCRHAGNPYLYGALPAAVGRAGRRAAVAAAHL